jgi:hypothetical protein
MFLQQWRLQLARPKDLDIIDELLTSLQLLYGATVSPENPSS